MQAHQLNLGDADWRCDLARAKKQNTCSNGGTSAPNDPESNFKPIKVHKKLLLGSTWPLLRLNLLDVGIGQTVSAFTSAFVPAW